MRVKIPRELMKLMVCRLTACRGEVEAMEPVLFFGSCGVMCGSHGQARSGQGSLVEGGSPPLF